MNHRRLGLAACLAAAVVVSAGCSSSGGAQQTASTEAASANGASTPRLKIAMVTHGPAGDKFWDVIQQGAKDAAAKGNIDLVYASDADGAAQATLIQNAVDQKVDGLVVSLNKGEAVKDAVGKAVAAGIPVVSINGGGDLSERYGALVHVGQNETLAGTSAGERLAAEGYKHAVCVSPEQGNSALEDRCNGLAAGLKGGTSETLYVNGTDLASVSSTLTAKIQQDPTIDVVFALGTAAEMAAVGAVDSAGSKAIVAGIDLDEDVTAAIQDGSIEFSVDQQPYAQGYEGIDSLWLYLNHKIVLGGGDWILTGPSIVDKSSLGGSGSSATTAGS